MALVELLTVGAGSAVAKWALRSWLPGEPGEFAADLSDIVTKRVEGFFEKRNVARQFDQIAEAVAERLTDTIPARLRGLPLNEQKAAAIAVGAALEAGVVSTSVLVEHDLDAHSLEKHLRRCSPDRARRALLNEQATELYDLLFSGSVQLCCRDS